MNHRIDSQSSYSVQFKPADSLNEIINSFIEEACARIVFAQKSKPVTLTLLLAQVLVAPFPLLISQYKSRSLLS